jgi:hypothetical protein
MGDGESDARAARAMRGWLRKACSHFCRAEMHLPEAGVERFLAAARAAGLSRGSKLAATLRTLPPEPGLSERCANLSDIGLRVRCMAADISA